MRKVLAKYPQVEHKRLHRRVFLDNIDPDNQALLILVSCFVKTSHFEEYLRVKEIILLDLLKVISHHNARLATPIRTIQRVYDESEARQAPRSGESSYRPFLLVGSSSSGDSNEAHNKGVPLRNVATAEKSSLDSEQVVSSMVNGEGSQDLKTKSKSKEKAQVVNESISIKSALASTNNGQGSKLQLEGLDSMGLHSNDITLLGAAFEKPPAKIPEGRLNSGPSEKSSSKTPISEHGVQNQGTGGEILAGRAEKVEASEGESSADLQEVRHIPKITMDLSLQDHRVKSNSNESHDDPWKTQGSLSTATPGSKQEDGLSYSRTASPVDIGGGTSVGRSQSVEENLVLGVALDGPKRTLPLDNKISSSTEQKDFVASRNGSGNSSKDRQESTQNKGLSSS
ncbi:hypothetical protein O6H91_Y430600 [Diphasiastrum complanatum]|nr:hypothetical protein O6H91_Y430600 [Diphasiastrum complanatum]